MVALDTNVIVRYIAQDDPLQRMRYTTLKDRDAYEITRLYTRFSKWNKDSAAVGKFQFVE